MSNLNQNNRYIWFVFILWPFLSFFIALNNIFQRNSQKIIMAFAFLYGYSVFLESGDILRFRSAYLGMPLLNWDDYFFILTHFWSPEKLFIYGHSPIFAKPDIYALSLSFIISRFTDNPRWFWAFASLINSFFVFEFLNFLKYEIQWIKNYWVQKIFFIGLLMIVPFYYPVSGIRFWTALLVFVLYAMKYLHFRKSKYLVYASFSILIHYSFGIPVMLLIFSRLILKNRFLYLIFLGFGLIYFAINTVSSTLIIFKSTSTVLEDTTISDNTSSYIDDEQVNRLKSVKSNRNWYVNFKDKSMLYFFMIVGFIDVVGLFRFKENNFTKNTYPLVIIFLIFLLIISNIDSLLRYQYIFFILYLTRLIALSGIQPFDRNLKKISRIFITLFIFYMIVVFRAGLYTVDPFLLLNNAVGVFFLHGETSLSEFIVGH